MLPTTALSRCRSPRRNTTDQTAASNLGERPVLVVRGSSVQIEGRRTKPQRGSMRRAVPDLRSKALPRLSSGENARAMEDLGRVGLLAAHPLRPGQLECFGFRKAGSL